MLTAAFRVDASTTLGSGHIRRCATLAECLRERGLSTHFLCRELPGNACDWLIARGHTVHRLAADIDADADINASRAILEHLGGVDCLVVDHYGLDASWESSLRPYARRLLVIDDLSNRDHDCDLLLDQNYLPDSETRYSTHLPASATCLIGPRYALLPPDFAARRPKTTRPVSTIRKVQVCFGGSDPQGHTLAALSALAPVATRLSQIDVVVGSACPHFAAIATATAALPNARLLRDAANMAELLSDVDLAIGGGGTMNWERACLGTPALTFGIADNQRPGLTALIADGYVVGNPVLHPGDPEPIAAWLNVLLSAPELIGGYSQRAMTLVDGYGTLRVADHLYATRLQFRPVTPADTQSLRAWRNAPEVRKYSLDTREIAADEHATWLARTLADPQRILVIAELAGQPVGVARFDLNASQATISVFRIQDAPLRLALVRQASDWLLQAKPEIRRIVAEVVSGNHASLAAFANAGYRPFKHTLVLDRSPT